MLDGLHTMYLNIVHLLYLCISCSINSPSHSLAISKSLRRGVVGVAFTTVGETVILGLYIFQYSDIILF